MSQTRNPAGTVPDRVLSVRVPASTSNLGAGFDFFGMALDWWLDVRLIPGPGPSTYGGTLSALPPERDLIRQKLEGAELGTFHIEVESAIPVARGLGSSAAATVAAVALTRLATGAPWDHLAIYAEAMEQEGHPDNAAAAVFGGAQVCIPGITRQDPGGAPIESRPMPTGVRIASEIAVALAIPETSIETKRARSVLPADVSRAVAVRQAGRAAALIMGLRSGDPELLRRGMVDEIAVPVREALIPGYRDAVRSGVEAGAYGVTLSGSGSTVIALGPVHHAPAVAVALADALKRAGNPAQPHTPSITRDGVTVNLT
jgi:homoserine kinase